MAKATFFWVWFDAAHLSPVATAIRPTWTLIVGQAVWVAKPSELTYPAGCSAQ